MERWRQALDLLPVRFYDRTPQETLSKLEEIRLRSGGCPYGLIDGEERPLVDISITQEDLDRIMERATGASLHSSIEALRSGYLTSCGLRIGVCGTVIQEGEQVVGFQHITSLAIRIPRECREMCDTLVRQLYPLGFQNTVILSPPGGGKTTALRDIVRGLSDRGYRISVIDERNELSASEGGKAGFDLGKHTDVLIGSTKAAALMMLLRAMNPQILAMDEITCEKDGFLLRETIGCGVGILATAHASNLAEFMRRPLYRMLAEEKVFTWAVTIRQNGSQRSLTSERVAGCAG